MNIYYTLKTKTNNEIADELITRLNIISQRHNIITIYGFDEDSHDTFMAYGSGLEVLGRNFNNSYITTNIAKNDPYIINIKLVLQHVNALNIETKEEYNKRCSMTSNGNGEVWTIYLKSVSDLLEIFDFIGKSEHFSDAHNEINNNELDNTIESLLYKDAK